jgi:CBS domain containing-hemolysin-like protein
VPAVGERFDVDGLSVEVLDAERRRVNKVRIYPSEAQAEVSSGPPRDDAQRRDR